MMTLMGDEAHRVAESTADLMHGGGALAPAAILKLDAEDEVVLVVAGDGVGDERLTQRSGANPSGADWVNLCVEDAESELPC